MDDQLLDEIDRRDIRIRELTAERDRLVAERDAIIADARRDHAVYSGLAEDMRRCCVAEEEKTARAINERDAREASRDHWRKLAIEANTTIAVQAAQIARARGALRALLDCTAPNPIVCRDGSESPDLMDCIVCDGDRMAAAVDHHVPGCEWLAAERALADAPAAVDARDAVVKAAREYLSIMRESPATDWNVRNREAGDALQRALEEVRPSLDGRG